MNRPIKFRAWYNAKMEYNIEDCFNKCLNDWDNLMQFTGLHDKNGNEIYEGDVVLHGGKWVIYYDVSNACFGGYDSDNSMNFRNNFSTNMEVIGNIYENSELIK